ncbi:phage minor head protein [Ruminococcus callidus]|uniref:phage minor head protein n=1 Tax=Ruminococcus callidus TaxID=40519 RepID=UPI003521A536
MTPAQKQTTQYELLSEKKVMEQLERSYQKALEDVKDRLRQLDERTDVENRQAVAYQKAFQQGLQKQLERILGKLHSKTYRTVQEYLQDCYLTGHTAVLYELQSDGLRLSLPIPQDKVCQAAVNDTKLVKPLYDSIGEDFAGLKKHITDIVSAGFASGASYGDMANQITGKMIGNYATMRGGALGRAKLIVRTEGNRIANAARLEAARTAKQQGADLVKQWDSTMDKKTRPHHVQLDGQVRELDEPFEVDGRKAQAPGRFGIASEDINCRCHAYSRPRWAVRTDSDYKYDNQHRALVKVSSESYAAYRAGYVQETAGKPDGTVPVPAGHAAEVAPPATKDNGGTGKTYRAEKIKYLKGNYSIAFDKVSGTKEITPQLAKEFSDEYDRFGQKFGETPSVRSVLIEPYKNNGIWGTYNDNNGTISISGAGGKDGKNTISKVAAEMKKTGKWSSSSPYHAFRHELGHALQKHLKDTVPDYEERLKKVRDIRDAFFESLTGLDEDAIMKLKKEALSIYGLIDDESLDEFISECVAEYCSKKPRKMSRDVVAALLHKGGNENAD